MLVKKLLNSQQIRNFLNFRGHYNFSSQFKADILSSNYHQVGPSQFKKSRTIEKLLSNQLTIIQSLQDKLDPLRTNVVKSIDMQTKREPEEQVAESPQITQYVEQYESLIKAIEACQINNEWIYNIISWYNMTSFYKVLLDRLIKAKNEQIYYLVKALHTMKYDWKNQNGYIDEVFFKDPSFSSFYKRLDTSIDLGLLIKIDSILKAPLEYSKRRYFQKYLQENLESLLKNMQFNEAGMISELIWLFQASIKYMNNDEILISKIEKYILTMRLNLQNSDIERVINAYLLKGKIHPNIYKQYIKPYILKQKMKNYNNVVQSIRFLICSEAQDNQLLQKLYTNVSQMVSIESLQPRNIEVLHIYTHYLRLKGTKFNLKKSLQSQLNQFCKQINKNSTNFMGKLANEDNEKKIHPQKWKFRYASQCNHIKKPKLQQISALEKKQFQQNFSYRLASLNLKTLKIYKNARLCCFNLEYCLHSSPTSQLINLESHSIENVFTSGQLTRQYEIRDQILTFYGLKINHIDLNRFKNKGKLDENELLITRKATPNKR